MKEWRKTKEKKRKRSDVVLVVVEEEEEEEEGEEEEEEGEEGEEGEKSAFSVKTAKKAKSDVFITCFRLQTRPSKHISDSAVCTQPPPYMYKPRKKISAIVKMEFFVISPRPTAHSINHTINGC